ncbi:MAG: hypothetical protein AB7N65_10570 [Vicinamibacterales bacterium]
MRWAETSAVPLERAPEVLARCLPDARVVFVAESDHFAHETHLARRALLPYLVDRGARALLEEIAASDGRRIQRYLDTGQPGWLDRVATFGNTAVLRTDRDDRMGGLLATPSYPFAAMRFEHQRTLDTVAGRGICFVGLDMDALPGGVYEDIDGLSRVAGESRADEIRRLSAIAATRPDQAVALSAHLDGLRFLEACAGAQDWSGIQVAMTEREAGLFGRAAAALAIHPDAVVLGHVGHLVRAPAAMRMLDVLAGPPPRTLGSRIAERGPVASIWTLHGEGSTAHALAGLPETHALVPGTLNALLSGVGEAFVLPIRGTEGEVLLDDPMICTWQNGGRFEARLARQADAIVFFRRITPLHEV